MPKILCTCQNCGQQFRDVGLYFTHVESHEQEEKKVKEKLSAQTEKESTVIVEAELIPPNAAKRIVKALRGFEEVKRNALRASDFAIIQGKKHVKKSGCSLLAAVCNVSTQKVDERVEDLPNEERVYHFTYRAIAQNGRFADAVGSASTKEKQFTHPHHDARTLAQTRAYNRVILNLVAAGEVSAEEMIPVEVSEQEEVDQTRLGEAPDSHPVTSGTSPIPESPIPKPTSPETQPAQKSSSTPTESKDEGWQPKVPITSELRAVEGIKQYPLERDRKKYGVLNAAADGSECAIVPEHHVLRECGPIGHLIYKVLEPMKREHGFEYQVKLTENKVVQWILVRAKNEPIRDKQILELRKRGKVVLRERTEGRG